MVDIETARQYALSLPHVEEKDHFGMPSFRLKNKIFSTLWVNDSRAMVRLSLVDQSVFCSYDSTVFFPVPGGWGTKGATFVDLTKVRKSMFKDALKTAYNDVGKNSRPRVKNK